MQRGIQKKMPQACGVHTLAAFFTQVLKGIEPYEVEFQYRDGRISSLFCGCPCGHTRRHEAAALLQLRETLEIIDRDYPVLVRYRYNYLARYSQRTVFHCT